MSIREEPISHLSDDQLLLFFYSGGTSDSHALKCSECQNRLRVLQVNRERIEEDGLATVDVSVARLAAQRRDIYTALARPSSMFAVLLSPKWISAVATILILCGSLFLYQHQQQGTQAEDKISDVELAQEVSRLSQSVEPLSADPLKGLFE